MVRASCRAIADLFRAYISRKRAKAQLDFDDLLLLWRAALGDDRLGPHMIAMFDHVLVDEYQDVNALQVESCAPSGQTGVGHRRRRRRASDLRFPRRDARLSARARELLAQGDGHPPRAQLPVRATDLEPGQLVRPVQAGVRLKLNGERPGGRRPVLVRCHDAPSEARGLSTVSSRPTRGDGGFATRRSSCARPITATSSSSSSPRAGSLPQVRRSSVRGGGAREGLRRRGPAARQPGRRTRMVPAVAHARGHRPGPRPDADRVLAPGSAPAPTTGTRLWPRLPRDRASRPTHTGGCTPPAGRSVPPTGDCGLAVLAPTRPQPYSDGPARIEDLDRLCAAAAAMDDLSAWLAEITLDLPCRPANAGPPHLDEDYVVISTVHSAKGLEWSAVHLPHLIDGAFPSDMALGSGAGLAGGTAPVLCRHDPGARPAHPVHTAADAHPPAGPQRSALPGSGEPVPFRRGPRRPGHPRADTGASEGDEHRCSSRDDHGRPRSPVALTVTRS